MANYYLSAARLCLISYILTLTKSHCNRLFKKDVVSKVECAHSLTVMNIVKRCYNEGIGKSMREGKETLESLAAYAQNLTGVIPGSGRQEYLESVMNDILFSGV